MYFQLLYAARVCQGFYSLNYLNVQEEYQLSGKITVIKNSRKWHFNTQKKTEYNGSGIRTEFNKEMRFMGGLCGLLEKEKLIPRG
mgnify:CR=1 FL=1